jgi:hypothetical protein
MAQTTQPACQVDIYPWEGGSSKYTITKDQVLSASVTNSVTPDGGGFVIELIPGGPLGLNMTPSWLDIITPMSFVVVAMSRDDSEGIVMLGVVTSAQMTEQWVSGRPTPRRLVIQGQDFTYFFQQSTYYNLWYLGLLGTLDPGVGSDGSSSWITGTPDALGKTWFTKLMSQAFENTFVQYQGAEVTFPNIVASLFQPYDFAPGESVFIPTATYLISDDTTWADKFHTIFPFPWYEFFVNTAPTGFYKGSSGGKAFTSTLLPKIPSTPQVVARVNPLPKLRFTVSGDGPVFNAGIDATLWNNLPVFSTDDSSTISSAIVYDQSEVVNYFMLNPTYKATTTGQSNNSLTPWLSSYNTAADARSIQRYGYRPVDGSFSWMCDPNLTQAQQPNSWPLLLGELMARFAAYYEPTPIMAKGQIVIPLRPDIMPGCRFIARPFKIGSQLQNPTNVQNYIFYIESVAHNYVFGGPSTTTLTLKRGLPVPVYDDQAVGGKLWAAHVGNLERLDGLYTIGAPGNTLPSLQSLPIGNLQGFFSMLGKAYVTPQGQSGG